jgi:hypothetical protein
MDGGFISTALDDSGGGGGFSFFLHAGSAVRRRTKRTNLKSTLDLIPISAPRIFGGDDNKSEFKLEIVRSKDPHRSD